MKLLWLLFLGGGVLAMERSDPQDLDLRLQSLESRVPARPVGQEDLDVFQEMLHKQVELENRQLDQQIISLQNRFALLERQFDHMKYWMALFGIGGLALIYSQTRSHVNRSLTRAWDAKSETIRAMVREADLDTMIHREDRVTIVSEDGRELRESLRRMGFCQLRLVAVDPASEQPEGLELQAPDLLILAVRSASWNEAFVAQYPEALLCFWTGAERILSQHVERVTFANSKITLYHRLMEMARYRRLAAARP